MVRIVRYISLVIVQVVSSGRTHSTNLDRTSPEIGVHTLRREVELIVTWDIATSVESLRWHNENLGLTHFFASSTFVVPSATHHHGKSVSSAAEATELAGVRIVYAEPCASDHDGGPRGSWQTITWCRHMAVAAALAEGSCNNDSNNNLGYLILSYDSVIVDFPKLALSILEKGKSVAFCQAGEIFDALNPSPQPSSHEGANNLKNGAECATLLRNLPSNWQSRYVAAVGSATALPNETPCTADFFYLGPSAAKKWCEVAALFRKANDEACLGAMIALASSSSSNVIWLPQPRAQVELSNTTLNKLQFIKNNPDIIIAQQLKPSVKMERDWTLAHYGGNWAKWYGSDELRLRNHTSALMPRTIEKLTFIHVPKTGGESVEKALSIQKDHSSAFARNSCKPASDKSMRSPGAVWFSIVRNPYSRLFSWFKFCIHGAHGANPGPIGINLCHTLNKWATDVSSNGQPPSLASIRENFNLWLLATKAVFDKQSATQQNIICRDNNHALFVWGTYEMWLKDQAGDLIVDAVIRFEDLYENKAYGTIADALGAALGVRFSNDHPACSPLPHENSESSSTSRYPLVSEAIGSARWPIERWFDNTTWGIVEKHFKGDLLWLGY